MALVFHSLTLCPPTGIDSSSGVDVGREEQDGAGKRQQQMSTCKLSLSFLLLSVPSILNRSGTNDNHQIFGTPAAVLELPVSHWTQNCSQLYLNQSSCLENPVDGGAWWAAVHGVAKSRTRLSNFTFTFHFHSLEKAVATHSSVLAWRIPGTGEPGGLTGSHTVRHDWSSSSIFKPKIKSTTRWH